MAIGVEIPQRRRLSWTARGLRNKIDSPTQILEILKLAAQRGGPLERADQAGPGDHDAVHVSRAKVCRVAWFDILAVNRDRLVASNDADSSASVQERTNK